MASRTMSPSIWYSLGNLFGGLTGNAPHRSKLQPSPEELRAERDFINEMIWKNPDAFSGELDVQNMMHMYPGKF